MENLTSIKVVAEEWGEGVLALQARVLAIMKHSIPLSHTVPAIMAAIFVSNLENKLAGLGNVKDCEDYL